MMKKMTVMAVTLIALSVVALGGTSFADINNSGYGNGQYVNGCGRFGGQATGFRSGHMGYGNGYSNGYGWTNQEAFDPSDVLPMETLKENVEGYLDYFEGSFEIEDIFVYENSDYYFSVVEEETGRGAMELLVNPITGDVYPEHGPNMMWNTAYGMHGAWGSNTGYGYMHGGFYNADDYTDADTISVEDALDQAADYLEDMNSAYRVEDGGHAFYGYYTFHVLEDDETVGMLSVNAFTGDVWFHNWHGTLMEVISEHHDE